jgi:glutaredoxin
MPKLYVKTGCPWCEEAIDFLDKKEISYEKIVVSNNASAMKEMIDLSGQSKAPTLDWEDDVLADFGVDELLPFLKKHGAL